MTAEGRVPPYAGRPYVLSEITYASARPMDYELAVLPWGATEAHNLHLPYGTDTIQVEYVAAEAARLAWERGASVIVLPPIPLGVHTGQLDVPLCLNLNPTTQLGILRDVADTLARQGLTKLVILNGHGANDFKQMIRELLPVVPLFISTVNWYEVLDPAAYFQDPGDHAGELETSAMLHLSPALVRPLEEAGPGKERRFRIAALREGWAWAPRRWTAVTDDTGVGDPAAGSANKGARYLAAVAEKIAGFLVELAKANPSDLYGE